MATIRTQSANKSPSRTAHARISDRKTPVQSSKQARRGSRVNLRRVKMDTARGAKLCMVDEKRKCNRRSAKSFKLRSSSADSESSEEGESSESTSSSSSEEESSASSSEEDSSASSSEEDSSASSSDETDKTKFKMPVKPKHKLGDKYCVRHSAHVVKIKRLLLTDALASGNTDGWSEARLKAYNKRETNPNAYYYRFNDPGEEQKTGAWSKEEMDAFILRVKEVGVNGKWGIFAMKIPGRVGYQCSNMYRKMIEQNIISDPNYVLDDDGKARFLKEKGKSTLSSGSEKDSANSNQAVMMMNGVPVQFLQAPRQEKPPKPRAPAVVRSATGQHYHGHYLFKSVLIDNRKYKVGDKIWVSPEMPVGNVKPKQTPESMPVEIERITQIRDPALSDGWTPQLHCRKMYTLAQLKKVPELEAYFDSAKRNKFQNEKEIFDSFETIEVHPWRVCFRVKLDFQFSRKMDKNGDYFGRYLFSPEIESLIFRTGQGDCPISTSALKAQIRKILRKRKRIREREEWREYSEERKRLKQLEEDTFKEAEAASEAVKKRCLTHERAEGNKLSPYEVERRKNIRANEEYLAKLGLI